MFCLLLATVSRGDALDEAVRSLAKKVSARLTAADAPRVTARNISSLSNVEVGRTKSGLERALRRATARATQTVDVRITISENQRGFLLVAETLRDNDRGVDIAVYRPEIAERTTRSVLEKRLLWEQESPILDVAIVDDKMIVLEPATIVVYARKSTTWDRADSRALDMVGTVRDPRGRLQVSDGSITAWLPGFVCRGSWMPSLDISCESGDPAFPLSGESVKFTMGRDTLEFGDWPPFYSYARIGALQLLAEADTRTHVYESGKTLVYTFSAWGSDFTIPENGCAANRFVLATSSADRDAPDTLTSFEFVDRKPVPASDPISFPGPITALWPAGSGVTAIARNLASGQYAAYSITIDCGL